jgi:hypothetical protein
LIGDWRETAGRLTYVSPQGHAKKTARKRAMRKCIILWKSLFATAPTVAMALGFMTIQATAALSTSGGKHRMAAVPAHLATYRAHVAHRKLVRGVDNGRPVNGAVPQIVNTHRVPGFAHVPGRGTVDEACNLPTSACPDWRRDVQ